MLYGTPAVDYHSLRTYQAADMLISILQRHSIIIAVLLGLLLASPLAQVGAQQENAAAKLALTPEEQAWLAAHPVIRMGIDPYYGPYSFLDERGQLQGLVREFLDYFEQTLGLRFEIIGNLDWPQLMDAAQLRRLDAVATTVRLPERETFLEFTRNYLPTPVVIITRHDTPQLASLNNLRALRLTLVEDYSSSKQVMDEYPGLRPLYVTTPLDGLRAVAANRADAYVGALGVSTFLASQHGINNLKVNAGFDMGDEGQHIGVRKDWPQLTSLLDRALAAMPARQRADIMQKWLPVQAGEIKRLSQPSSTNRLFPWLFGLVGLTLLAYLAMLLWNRQLKRELALRQQDLADSADRFQTAEDIAHVGHWQYRVSDGDIQWSNEAYRIFGLEPQSRPISYDWLIAHVHPDDRAWHDAYLQSMLDSQPGAEIPAGRYRLLRANGEERNVKILVRIDFDAAGKPSTLFGTLQDISEQVAAEARLAALNRLYRVQSGINAAVMTLREPQALYTEACRIAVETGGFRMAWLGMIDAGQNEIKPLAHAGVTGHYLDNLSISLDDDELGQGPTGRALRSGQYAVSNHIASDPRMAPWRDTALTLGYQSSAALPIRVGEQVRGVFNLYADSPGFFDDNELHLLDKLARDIGFAVELMEVERSRETLNRRLVDMLESMSDGFVSLDRNWRYQYVNLKAGELLGRPAKTLVGKHIWTEFPEGVGQPFQKAYQRAMDEGVTMSMDEFYAPWQRWFENRIYPTADGISIFFTDITTRKLGEASLRESEARQKLFIEHAPAALAMFDRAMRYLVVSRRWLTDYGMASEDILGRCHYEVFPEISERWKAVHSRALAGEVVRAEEDCFERQDGKVQWLHWEVRPWYAADESVGGIVIFSEDITARKEAEDRARQNDLVLDSVFEALPDLFFLMDADGTILDYRVRQASKLYVPPETFLGKHMQDVLPLAQGEQFLSKLDQVNATGGLVTFEYDLTMAEIEHRFEARLTRLPDSTQLIAVVRDISREHQDRELLAGSEARYRQLFEQNPTPVLVYEKGSLRLLAVNEAFTGDYGYSSDEALALRVPDLYPAEEKQAIIDMTPKLTGLAYVGEWHHLKKDGSQMTVEVHSHDIDYQGRKARITVITDISQRKQMERRLREQLDELSRWQAVMLGREGRIEELKTEVNTLLANQHQPVRYPSQVEKP